MTVSLITIKGIKIEDHEIRMVNFPDNVTIFLRDITCLDKIQIILKLYGDVSSSKIDFAKAKPYRLKHIKIKLNNQDK